LSYGVLLLLLLLLLLLHTDINFSGNKNYSFAYCFLQQKVFILVCCIQSRTLLQDIREQRPKEDT